MPDIAVIIVNWNACEDLRRCLASLFAAPPPACDWAVWVVDNASADGSADMVAADFPTVKLIRNTENVGFSRANNQAMDEAKDSRYLFLLNSDAWVESPATLDDLVAFGDANQQAAIIGAHVLNPDGTIQYSCRAFPNLWAGLFRNTLLGRLFPNSKFIKAYLMADVNHDVPRSVHWVSGCAMLIRGEFLREHGGFDPIFYMYCEDVDICKRAWDNNWQVWYCATAYVRHKIGASSDRNAEPMIWAFHKSWEQFYLKHNPRAPAIKKALVHAGLWLRASVRIWNRRRRGVKPGPADNPSG